MFTKDIKMSKTVKVVIVAAIGMVLGVALFAGWFAFQMRDMHLLDHAKIDDDLYVVKGGMSNMYLMNSGDGYVAFDASDNQQKLIAGCKEMSIDPAAVRAVFLTHTDRDHVDGLPLFSNAVVYLPAQEESLLTSKKYRHFLGLQHQNKLPIATNLKVNDGDSVRIGRLTIHAIATPGHTVGSTCFRVGGSLFTGDLLMLVNGSVHTMIKLFTEDIPEDSCSIRKIAERRDISRIYTAHSGVSEDFGHAFSSWKQGASR